MASNAKSKSKPKPTTRGKSSTAQVKNSAKRQREDTINEEGQKTKKRKMADTQEDDGGAYKPSGSRKVNLSPTRASQRTNAGTSGEIVRKARAFEITDSTLQKKCMHLIDEEPENDNQAPAKPRKQTVAPLSDIDEDEVPRRVLEPTRKLPSHVRFLNHDAVISQLLLPSDAQRGQTTGSVSSSVRQDSGQATAAKQDGQQAAQPSPASQGGQRSKAKPGQAAAAKQDGQQAAQPPPASQGGQRSKAKPGQGTKQGRQQAAQPPASQGGQRSTAKPGQAAAAKQDGQQAAQPPPASQGGQRSKAKPGQGTKQGRQQAAQPPASQGGQHSTAKPGQGTKQGGPQAAQPPPASQGGQRTTAKPGQAKPGQDASGGQPRTKAASRPVQPSPTDVLQQHRIRNRATKPPTVERLEVARAAQERLGDTEDDDTEDDDTQSSKSKSKSKRRRPVREDAYEKFYPSGIQRGLKLGKYKFQHLVTHHMFPEKEDVISLCGTLASESIQEYETWSGSPLQGKRWYEEHSEGMSLYVLSGGAAFRSTGKSIARLVVTDKYKAIISPDMPETSFGQAQYEATVKEKIEECLWRNQFLTAVHEVWIWGVGQSKPFYLHFPRDCFTQVLIPHIAAAATLIKNVLDETLENRSIKISQQNYGVYYKRVIRTIEKALGLPQGPRILAVWDSWMEKLRPKLQYQCMEFLCSAPEDVRMHESPVYSGMHLSVPECPRYTLVDSSAFQSGPLDDRVHQSRQSGLQSDQRAPKYTRVRHFWCTLVTLQLGALGCIPKCTRVVRVDSGAL
ncbi:hypothetical protein C8R44DRAFT_731800 [Mycena epipterygia]|nr:hypothetical protein C8R44DRAFT_731800 [Mycena epipterygia]